MDQSDALDLLDIPMDDIYDTSELDDYLSKPVEKVRDPIGWWWHRHASYAKLSKMSLDYLSVPCELFHISCSSIKSSAVLLPATSTAVECVSHRGGTSWSLLETGCLVTPFVPCFALVTGVAKIWLISVIFSRGSGMVRGSGSAV